MWCSCAADLAWLLQQPGHTVGIHWFEDCGGKPASVQIYRKHLRHFVLLYFSCEIITSRRKTPCTTRSCFAFRDPARRQVCQHCACVAFQGLMAWPWALLTECCVIELSTSVHLTSPVCFCCTSAYQSIWSVTCQCWQLCFRHPFPNR